MNDLQARLRAAFRIEAAEHLEYLRTALPLLGAADADGSIDEIYRRAHSLKGAARAVGLRAVETMAHRLEDVFARLRSRRLTPGAGLHDAIGEVVAVIEDHVALIDNAAAAPAIDAALAMLEAVSDDADTVAFAPSSADGEPAAAAAAVHSAAATVRVQTRSLDALLQTAGALMTASLRQAAAISVGAQAQAELAALRRDWEHVRLSDGRSLRDLAETAGHAALARFLQSLDQRLREIDRNGSVRQRMQRRGADDLRHIAEQLQDEVRAARLVPVGSIVEGFRKMVRDMARDQSKRAELHMSGLEVVADRTVLQALKEPLMHLLRNAVSHGLESPAERSARGKPEVGMVGISVAAEHHRLRIAVSDDGAGLDVQAIAERAVALGLATDVDAASPDADALARLICLPAFSTAPAVTEVSGRGMGLSAVYEAVRGLQGQLEIPAQATAGLTVVVDVPLSVSLQRLLLVRCRDRIMAVPFHAIERLQRIGLADITTVEGRAVTTHEGDQVPVTALAALLELDDGAIHAESTRVPALVLRGDGDRLVLVVDELCDEIEAVVQELGCHGGMLEQWCTGCIVLGDGTICPVLNTAGLRASFGRSQPLTTLRLVPGTVSAPRRPTILVVDDSFTTRTLEKSLLEAQGYHVEVAVDGVDALNKLRLQPADVIISDVQMPRMDGFELLAAVKRDPRLARTPVIIVTSVDAREDQQRGLALGADAYVLKQKFDQHELLEAIQQLV